MCTVLCSSSKLISHFFVCYFIISWNPWRLCTIWTKTEKSMIKKNITALRLQLAIKLLQVLITFSLRYKNVSYEYYQSHKMSSNRAKLRRRKKPTKFHTHFYHLIALWALNRIRFKATQSSLLCLMIIRCRSACYQCGYYKLKWKKIS